MFQRIVLSIVLVLALSSLIGCASIIHGSKQKLTFGSTPTGATVDVTDAMGVSHGTCITPCTLDLKRKNQYKATLRKDGFEPVELVVNKNGDGWVWGNLLFGGIIGLVVDFSSGAAYKLSPSELHATLPALASGLLPEDSDETTLVLVDFDDLTTEERAAISQMETVPWQSSNVND
jgi:hypothetical protein